MNIGKLIFLGIKTAVSWSVENPVKFLSYTNSTLYFQYDGTNHEETEVVEPFISQNY